MAKQKETPSIVVHVYDQPRGSKSRHPIVNASLSLFAEEDTSTLIEPGQTDRDGRYEFTKVLPGKNYWIYYLHAPVMAPETREKLVTNVQPGSRCDFNVGLNALVTFSLETGKHGRHPGRPHVGESIVATISFDGTDQAGWDVRVDPFWTTVQGDPLVYATTVHRPGQHVFRATLLLPLSYANTSPAGGPSPRAAQTTGGVFAELPVSARFNADEAVPTPISGSITVAKTRTASYGTADLALDELIRCSTAAMSFSNYMDVINKLFCIGKDGRHGPCGDGMHSTGHAGADKVGEMFCHIEGRRALPFIDADSYRVLKAATEAFVMVNCAVAENCLTVDEHAMLEEFRRRDISVTRGTVNLADYMGASPGNLGMLPYLAIIRRKLPDVPILVDAHDAELCFGILQRKLSRPCMVELIWSYWHEEAMLVQTMNVITRRFQNVSSGAIRDPLANLEIDPLRPLNNLLWGYVQDEQHRLTVVRRAYEYGHQYGLRLDGKAVQNFRPADTRSLFLEAFHQLLRRCNRFYRQDDDTNVKADAFPVLNAIKEVHMILSQGAHNQFGDLPSTARVEMLMQQWLLARSEFREFLPTRIMVAYPEPWMDRVDAMKKLQGWTDISVMHFSALATFGEQLLLSIRYGAWSAMFDAVQAFNWARLWRPQVQGYIHSYRAVTGVDLTTEQPDPAADGTLPSVLLRRRLEEQARRERSL